MVVRETASSPLSMRLDKAILPALRIMTLAPHREFVAGGRVRDRVSRVRAHSAIEVAAS
jgi:hypothetical protein